MAFVLKDGQGTLFKNKKKEKPNQPDYTGQMRTLDGVLLRISGWIKEGQSGKWVSLSFQVPIADSTGRKPGEDDEGW